MVFMLYLHGLVFVVTDRQGPLHGCSLNRQMLYRASRIVSHQISNETK